MTCLKLLVEKDNNAVCKQATRIVTDLLKVKPNASLALPTGETAKRFYRVLAEEHKKGNADFSRASLFQLDELEGVGRRDHRSYAHYLHERFISKVNIRKKNVHLLNGKAKDPKEECGEYEKAVQKNGIDLIVLGLGGNGHIAFNEPGSAAGSKTRAVRLKKRTVNAKKSKDFVPERALSMGLATIMKNSERAVVIASGRHKADAVKCALKGRKKGNHKKCPAAILNFHKNAVMIADKDAAPLGEMEELGFTGKSPYRKNDIRGIFPTEIDCRFAERLGRALVCFLGAKRVAIGRDNRKSSAPLSKALVRGILAQGAEVADIGMCTSPANYFACRHLKADGAVMVTASHNPKEYNGFKITRRGAVPLSLEKGLGKIRALAENERYKKPKKTGKAKKRDIWKAYSRHVNGFGKVGKAKVVSDAGGGMAGLEIGKVLKRPLKLVRVNSCVAEAPRRIPNPFTDPKTGLGKRVVREKADLGICFDYDGDRVFFISEKGRKIRSEAIASLLIENHFAGDRIVYDVRSGWSIMETIYKCGCKGIMWKAGHTKIVEKMVEADAAFCGEASGHYYFRENFYNDSAAIAVIMVLALMRKTGKSISELVKKYEKYYQSGERNFRVRDRDKKIAEMGKRFRGGKRSSVDGLRVDYGDWWFSARKSQNEPLLRINIEAKSRALLKKKEKALFSIAKK